MIEMIDKETAHVRLEGFNALGRWISGTARAVGHAFWVLNRIQYDRPWNDMAKYCENLRDAGPAVCR